MAEQFHCLYVPHLFYPCICLRTCRLFPCPACCKQGCKEHSHTCTFVIWFDLTLVFSGFMPSSGLLGHTVVLFLVCSGTSILFSIVAVSAYFPTNSAECSLLSASSPALTVCTFSNGDHSDICEVTAHWHVDPVGEGEG